MGSSGRKPSEGTPRLYKAAGLGRLVSYFLMGAAEQKKLVALLALLILIDGLLVQLISNLCLSQALRSVLAWAFGSGTYSDDISWGVLLCFLWAGLLGYVLLGLVLYLTSKAVSRALEDEDAPTISQIGRTLFKGLG